jgi:hypothetical protein
MPNMEGFRLKSQAINRLSDTLQNIPNAMSQNQLREKQFDLTSAMTKRQMESQELGDRLTGLKIDAAEMANQDLREQRERLNSPAEFSNMFTGMSASENLTDPVGVDEKTGKPRVVFDNILSAIGATAQWDEKDKKLYATLPDGTRITNKYLEQHSPQFTAAVLANLNPRKAMFDQVTQINRQAEQAGGMTPEMAQRKQEIMAKMDDPMFLLDADLKNLAIASAIPGSENAIPIIQRRLHNYEQAIMNRAETEGKRDETQARIGMLKAQGAYYGAKAKAEFNANKLAQKGTDGITQKNALDMVKHYDDAIRKLMEMSTQTNQMGIPIEVDPEQQQIRDDEMRMLQQKRAYYNSLVIQKKTFSKEELQEMPGEELAFVVQEKMKTGDADGFLAKAGDEVVGRVSDYYLGIMEQMGKAGMAEEDIAAWVLGSTPKYVQRQLADRISPPGTGQKPPETKSRAKSTETDDVPLGFGEEPVDLGSKPPEKKAQPKVSAADMSGRPTPKAEAEAKGDDPFPDSLISRVKRNPTAYHPRQVSFKVKYDDYHGFLKMSAQEAEKKIREAGRKNNVPENVIENDIKWFKSMRGE